METVEVATLEKRNIKKIALLGPESTGKTELCIKLAKHYKTAWVPEFARIYIGLLHKKYSLEDVLYCMNKQLQQEESRAQKARNFLFCDTELINFKVWCADVFNTIPSSVEDLLKEHRYDFHLLTSPDVPFIADSVRENPTRREYFFEWYKQELQKYNFPYAVITGNGKARLENAINSIEKHFGHRPIKA